MYECNQVEELAACMTDELVVAVFPPFHPAWPPLSADNLRKSIYLDRGRCSSAPVPEEKRVNSSVSVVVGGEGGKGGEGNMEKS